MLMTISDSTNRSLWMAMLYLDSRDEAHGWYHASKHSVMIGIFIYGALAYRLVGWVGTSFVTSCQISTLLSY